MKRILILLSLSAVLLASHIAMAQSARLYTVASGLQSSNINGMMQDAEGYIWLRTSAGVERFDGSTFQQIGPSTDTGTRVRAMIQDGSGIIWMGRADGLYKYDPHLNSSEIFSMTGKSQVNAMAIRSLPGGGQRIYVSTRDSGFYVIDPVSGSMDPEIKHLADRQIGGQVSDLYVDSGGLLWVVPMTKGFLVLDSATGAPVEVAMDRETANLRNEIMVTSFAENPATGLLYIGTFHHGIFIFDRATMSLRRASGPQARRTKVRSLAFWVQPTFNTEDFLLVGTEDEGLIQFSLQNEEIVLPVRMEIPFRINKLKIHNILQDSQGNIWAVAYQRGLLFIPNAMYGFSTHMLSPEGLPGDNVAYITSICEDVSSETLYIGTDGGGVFIREGDKQLRYMDKDNSALTNNSIMDLKVDRRGRLWIATYMGGLLSYTRGEGVRESPLNPGFGSERIWCIEYDQDTDLLYVSALGSGLFIVDLRNGNIVRNIPELDGEWINTLYLARNGTLYVSTRRGPAAYDPRIGRVRFLENELLPPETQVSAFYDAPDGSLWLGSRLGLLQYNKLSHESRMWTTADGLAENTVRDILGGPDGDIWISTISGISRLDPRSGRVANFHSYDGIQSGEFCSGAAFMSAEDKMYFGGDAGLTSFYPHLVNRNVHPMSPVHMSVVTIMNKRVDFNPDGGEVNCLDAPVNEASTIILPRNCNVFAVGFSVLEYTNPERVRYAWSFGGRGDQWQIADNHTMADFANLRPGRHVLHVRAYFEDDEENYSSKDITIIVKAPLYLSGWAIALYLVLLGGIIAAGAWVWRKMKASEEEKKKARTDQMRINMFSGLTHEIRSLLFLVLTPLKKLRESETDPTLKDTYNLMYRNGLRVNRIVNQLLDIRKIDEGKMDLHFKKTDIIFFIKDLMRSFEQLSEAKGIGLTISSDAGEPEVWVDEGNFDKIIFNILSNAFKHTPPGGKVTIMLREAQAGMLDIRIENSGSHIDEEDLKKVFDRFFQAANDPGLPGSGVGLSLTKMLVELHHGSVWAENTDEGVAFTVRIPEGKSHLSAGELSYTSHHKDLYTKPQASRDPEIVADLNTPEGSEDPAKISRSRKHLVIVDDDYDTRSYLKANFKDYDVDTCRDGEEALRIITSTRTDAVITDLKMQGMDGFELCRKLKSSPATIHIPVIILTSASSEVNEKLCSDLGADKFFEKTSSIDILRSAVAQVISTREKLMGKYMEQNHQDLDAVKISSHEKQLMERISKAVQDNISNTEYGVTELSRDVGMSRGHLNRKLKEILGVSPSMLIKHTRLKQAAWLLVSTDNVNVSEVAYKVGFATQSYFSTSFHDYYGYSPREFIQMYNEAEDKDSLRHLFE